MMILQNVSKGIKAKTIASTETYSSLIQLPTEPADQLIPVATLPAMLSFRGFSRFDALTDIGCAPLPYCDPEAAPPKPLNCPPVISTAVAGRVSLPEVDCNAVVRFEVCQSRGEAGLERVAILMGVVRPGIPR